MLWSLVKVTFTLIFVTKITSTNLGQEQSILTQSVYYDCGSWIVSESRLQNMLLEDAMYIDKNAVPFIEFLYDLEPYYWKINIPKELSIPKSIKRINMRPGTDVFVIIGQMRQIIDVVTEMKNSHFIKCKRVDYSKPEPSNNGQKNYDYECGHDLFPHDIVQMSANLAQSYNGNNKLYLNLYDGPLYSSELNYFIYPLSREENQHYAGKVPENTYFVVISHTNEIIDVIAELKRGDFIKCARTTKLPTDIDSDKDLRLGYSCGFEFFEINHIKRTANLAKVKKLQNIKQTFPKRFKHDSFEGYMYPLLPNGRFHRAVRRPFKHFVIMNLDFSIKFAGVKTSKGIIKPCEASMRGIEAAPPETDNFICDLTNTEFKNERLLEVVKTTCKALGTHNRKYPANYHGPAFNVHGPYVTMPIRKGNGVAGPEKFKKQTGAGITIADRRKGISTMSQRLETICPFFTRMYRPFASCDEQRDCHFNRNGSRPAIWDKHWGKDGWRCGGGGGFGKAGELEKSPEVVEIPSISEVTAQRRRNRRQLFVVLDEGIKDERATPKRQRTEGTAVRDLVAEGTSELIAWEKEKFRLKEESVERARSNDFEN
ncbi:hypothetical protein EPUL_003671, partial [Erysiphe pulchra]